MSEKLTCPICGEPTRIYMGNARKDRLCGTHADMLKSGKIQTNEQGLFVDSKTNKILNANHQKKAVPVVIEETPSTETESVNPVITITRKNKSRCITCGKTTEDFLFCEHCYAKYKNKQLLFRIENCSSIELLDADYEGRFKCRDGHIVKSKSERAIDDYLYSEGIPHIYEKDLPYGADSTEILHPDFCLPNYLGPGKDIYIEHWGYNKNNLHYTKTKKFKMPIYKKLGITLICTHEQTDIKNIDAVLERKLNKAFIQEGQINFDI